jgi:hypothetical protein
MNEEQQQTPNETPDEKYWRMMGDGSPESLRAMVRKGTEDLKQAEYIPQNNC